MMRPHTQTTLAALLVTLVLSLPLLGKEGYPSFSWDKVPLYAHFGVEPEMTSEQYDFIAEHFSLVTLSAGKVRKDVEPILAKAAAEIKKRNPMVKVLFYWASDGPHGPFTESLASFPVDGYLEVDRKRPGTRTSKVFDRSRADVRTWWSGVAAKAVKDYSFDGVYADGTHPLHSRNLTGKISEKRISDVDNGMFEMFRETQQKMGPKKLLIFNALHGNEGGQYMPVTDGAMIDRFDRDDVQTKETMTEDLEAMLKAVRDGKIICFKAWPDFNMRDKEMMKRPHAELSRLAGEQITFPLASFLIAVGPHCYFQYTWGWLADTGTFLRHPEFDKPLGKPKGDAVRTGWTYRREFEHASVFINLENKTAEIKWN